MGKTLKQRRGMLVAVQQQNGSSEGWQRDGIRCSCLENEGKELILMN